MFLSTLHDKNFKNIYLTGEEIKPKNYMKMKSPPLPYKKKLNLVCPKLENKKNKKSEREEKTSNGVTQTVYLNDGSIQTPFGIGTLYPLFDKDSVEYHLNFHQSKLRELGFEESGFVAIKPNNFKAPSHFEFRTDNSCFELSK